MRRILPVVLALLLALAPLTLAACGTTTPDLYTMTLVYEPSTRSLAGEMTVQLENRTESAWETVKFQLWPNAFREGAKYLPVSETYAPAVYYKGASFGGITLTGVEGGEARVVGEDENILEVTPPAPVYPDERITLTMRFTVLLPEIEHRLGVGQKTVNLGNFYPILCAGGEEGFCEHVYACCGDPFVSSVADYDVTFYWHDLGRKGNLLTVTYDNQYLHSFSYYSEVIGSSNADYMVPNQFSHNLSLSYSIDGGRYNLSFECRNFTDENLYDNFSLQKAGRAFYGKVRVYFGN